MIKTLKLPLNCRYLFVTDPHLENNKNLPNVVKTFEWIEKVVEEKSINVVVNLGDFINSRDKIDSLALNKGVDILNRLSQRCIVILLLGNHEIYAKSIDFNVTSIRPFEKHAAVINKFKVVETENAFLYFVPYIESSVTFNEVIQLIYNNWPAGEKKSILLAHQEVSGAITNDLYNTYNKNGVDSGSLSRFDRVLLGHYHRHQHIGKNVTYVGSPLQLNFGEELSEKGVMTWDSKTDTWDFIINPHYECYKTVSSLDEDVKGKFVRYTTTSLLASGDIQRIKQDLFSKGALEVRVELKKQDVVGSGETGSDKLDLKELTRRYIKLNCNNLDENKLFEIGAKIKNEANERLLSDN